jgi:hypothetical protein
MQENHRIARFSVANAASHLPPHKSAGFLSKEQIDRWSINQRFARNGIRFTQLIRGTVIVAKLTACPATRFLEQKSENDRN